MQDEEFERNKETIARQIISATLAGKAITKQELIDKLYPDEQRDLNRTLECLVKNKRIFEDKKRFQWNTNIRKPLSEECT